MAWTESGLYVATLVQLVTAATAPSWTLTTNKFYLTTNSDTPDYTQIAASAIYSVTSETHDSGANWRAGGVATSGARFGRRGHLAGGRGSGKVLNYSAGNVAVSNTTIAAAAYGGFFYVARYPPRRS